MATRQALYVKTLERAIEALGSVGTVASKLTLSTRVVQWMLEGKRPVPEWVFLAAVDLLVAHDLRKGGATPSPKITADAKAPKPKPSGRK